MSRRLLGLAGLAALILATVAAAAASAGTWVQVSCVNPDGSAATSEGGRAARRAVPAYGSSNGANCGPGGGMFGALGATNPEPVGASEILQYTPPAGSTLIGGQVNVTLHADGGGTNASGTAVLYTPAFAYPDDVFFQCAAGLADCSPSGHDYAGVLSLPANRGGSLYVVAGCGGAAGYRARPATAPATSPRCRSWAPTCCCPTARFPRPPTSPARRWARTSPALATC